MASTAARIRVSLTILSGSPPEYVPIPDGSQALTGPAILAAAAQEKAGSGVRSPTEIVGVAATLTSASRSGLRQVMGFHNAARSADMPTAWPWSLIETP